MLEQFDYFSKKKKKKIKRKKAREKGKEEKKKKKRSKKKEEKRRWEQSVHVTTSFLAVFQKCKLHFCSVRPG